MLIRDDVRDKIADTLRSLDGYMAEEQVVPSLGWAYNRKAGIDEDPGPVLAFYKQEQIDDQAPPFIDCHEFKLYVMLPKELWEEYQNSTLVIARGNINFMD